AVSGSDGSPPPLSPLPPSSPSTVAATPHWRNNHLRRTLMQPPWPPTVTPYPNHVRGIIKQQRGVATL
ncbi:hypothetical protein U1Q18_015117, partial [Sarracenia purpurea var. burkii]